MMDPKIKAEWIAALRSGEYKQGKGFLCNGQGEFCCLGVLIDISQSGDWVWEAHNEDAGEEEHWSFKGLAGDLSLDMSRKLGIPNTWDLMRLNDDLGKSFPEIAKWIEENL